MASVFGQARRASHVSSKHHLTEQHTPTDSKEKANIVRHNGEHSVEKLAHH
jgi:hypothetical protein